MVQAWYQGGISIFDWTDPAHPQEIAFFDRGPVDSTKMGDAGAWSAYWYNGVIVSSEIGRGLDIFELRPSGFISQNELDAAKLVHLEYFNAQDQPRFVWPASFAVARAYLDQVARSNGLPPERLAATRTALARAERLSGLQRREALQQLAAQLAGDAQGAPAGEKLRTFAAEVRDWQERVQGRGRTADDAERLASLINRVPLPEWRADQGANQRAREGGAQRDHGGAPCFVAASAIAAERRRQAQAGSQPSREPDARPHQAPVPLAPPRT